PPGGRLLPSEWTLRAERRRRLRCGGYGAASRSLVDRSLLRRPSRQIPPRLSCQPARQETASPHLPLGRVRTVGSCLPPTRICDDVRPSAKCPIRVPFGEKDERHRDQEKAQSADDRVSRAPPSELADGPGKDAMGALDWLGVHRFSATPSSQG